MAAEVKIEAKVAKRAMVPRRFDVFKRRKLMTSAKAGAMMVVGGTTSQADRTALVIGLAISTVHQAPSDAAMMMRNAVF